MGLEKERNQTFALKGWPKGLGHWNYIAEMAKSGESRLGAGWQWGGFGYVPPVMPLWLTRQEVQRGHWSPSSDVLGRKWEPWYRLGGSLAN